MDPLTVALLFPIDGFIEIVPKRARTIIRTKSLEVIIPLKAESYLRYSRSGLYKKLGAIKAKRLEAFEILKKIALSLASSKDRRAIRKAYELVLRIYKSRKGRLKKYLFDLLREVTVRFYKTFRTLPPKLYTKNIVDVAIAGKGLGFKYRLLRLLGKYRTIEKAGLLIVIKR